MLGHSSAQLDTSMALEEKRRVHRAWLISSSPYTFLEGVPPGAKLPLSLLFSRSPYLGQFVSEKRVCPCDYPMIEAIDSLVGFHSGFMN